jgi:superfamily II DNA or RNA helicase
MSFFKSRNANFYNNNNNNNNNNKKNNVVEMPKNINTYLGQKGYTILKSELSASQQQYIKEQLLIKPCTPGAPIAIDKSFPAYRESDKKLYVPRYYGEQLFGKPNETKITEGTDIILEFQGSLRPAQEPVVKAYLDKVLSSVSVSVSDSNSNNSRGGGGLLELPCGFGKCLAIDTPIMMSDGTFKKVQDVQVGDKLMGDDSTPRNVLSLARGKEQMYKVSSKKGDEYIVNESHILSLKCSTNFKSNMKKGQIVDISVKDFLNLPKSYHGRAGPLLGYKVPVIFSETHVDFDPYLLGYWLGDGTSSHTGITTQESYIIKYLVELFKTKHTDLYLRYKGSHYDYRINAINGCKNGNSFMNFLRKNNLINNKHIPFNYKCNSRNIQLQLLAGIIDSDGYQKGNCYEICQKNTQLANDIVFLCRSLGFACYTKKCKKTCTNAPNGPKTGEYNRICVYGSGLEEIPVLCPRKKSTRRQQIKDALVYRITVDKLEVDNYYGFEIDGNRRFILGDFSVTHNTSISLYILSRLKKKTLVIVHKEFLMNQWIERIQQFLPTAKIGKIQGQIIDIEGKDIVLGMLQSLSMKDYPASVFDSFGLTIIDEVHHISSEVFSCALFKLVTKYMLGLSATMERSDGTTRVFKMFLGDVVYKQERSKDEEVIVRGITYQTNDDEYNELELDFRGKPASSKMLSKICNYNRRSEFILKVLDDMIKENPKQQIMIIASYRNILNYFYEAINHKQIATVGFYVGGMKEAALKQTEEKQVVLATYSMAAEGLDIKTLTTLIMATPMTKIEQSVGRILRQKHENPPIVVDIIDTHSNFQNQWLKRRRFFKTQNYKIIQTASSTYTTDVSKWKTTFTPSLNKTDMPILDDLEDNIDDSSDSEEITDSNTDSTSNPKKSVSGCLLKFKK